MTAMTYPDTLLLERRLDDILQLVHVDGITPILVKLPKSFACSQQRHRSS